VGSAARIAASSSPCGRARPGVMAPFGEAVIDRLSVSGVVPGSSTNEIPGGFTRVLTSPHHNWYYHAWA
jgi:hypothetical protein